uniref:DUF4789 domain-containing protein n=1 Tax=Daphnia galeata TaxID=27404 RepID=A0A8J2WJK6_9CRUS|nr:unnamed protein product [Daphnia galeata]
MDINCDPRFIVFILLLLFPLAFISRITSEPVQRHHRPSVESIPLSPLNDNKKYPWNQRLGNILIPRGKVGKSNVEGPGLESSIVPSSSESNLKILPPKIWWSLFNNRQVVTTTNTGCTCSDPDPARATFGRVCSTTCVTSETLLALERRLYRFFISLFTGQQFQGGQTFDVSYLSTSQVAQIDELDCELIESKCIARAALNQAKVTGALAAGAAIGLSIGIAKDKKSKSTQEEDEEEYYQELEYPAKLSRKSRSYFENLKSSMIPIDEQLENVVPRHLIDFVLKRVAQPTTGTCSCSVSIPLLYQQECSTTCLSSVRLCGDHFCTRTSVFNAFLYPTGDNSELTTQTFLAVNNKDCEKLKADCIASSAIFVVAKVGALVGLAAAALSSGMGVAAKLYLASSNNQSNKTQNVDNPLRSNNRRRRTNKEMKYFDYPEASPILESSIVQEKNLKRFHRNNLFGLFGSRQEGENIFPSPRGCTCEDPSPLAGTIGRACSTTCRNSETLCSGSRTCYRSTTFMAIYSLLTGSQFAFYNTTNQMILTISVSTLLTMTYSQINEERCEILESQCSAKDSIAKARQSAADVAALSVGLAAGAVGISLIKAKYNSERNNETYGEYDYYSQDYYKRQKRRRKMLSIKERKQTEFERWRNNLPSSEFDPSLLDPPPHVESSMQDELNVPTFGIFSGRQAGGCNCGCSIDDSPIDGVACSTTYFSSGQRGCGYCTLTSVFKAKRYLIGPNLIDFRTFSFLSVDNKDCEKLLIDCSVASSTIAAAGRVAAIAAGVGGGLSAGIAVAAVVVASNNNQQNNNNNNNNNNQQSNQLANQIPANNLPFPVIGINFPDDGSGDSAVRFPDGNNYSIFSKGPCNQTNQWVTVDPISLQGGCTPRLCEDERVFVGRTGLCHHINDPLECQGGRRLYYTAYGDPICDCPIGQYPFPDSTKDDCVSLFSRGPCPNRQVLVITPEGRLNCEPLECQSINGGDDGRFQQLVPDENGICFALGSRGTCSSTQLLGYDVFKRQLQCVVDPFSPDSSPSQRNELFHVAEDTKLYSQDYISERIGWIEYLIGISLLQSSKLMQPIERQDTAGILQVPSSLPDSLLQPCRSGDRQGANFKCANPLVKGPCNQTNQWVTVDPISLQGGCTPRLCEDERVFVGRTGLCHHINDPLECQGGRRLYYTAYGDPICDCPIGQYPFPDSTKDDCVSLFSRGPCPNRQVLVITPEGRLNCEPLECQSINGGDDGRFQQLVPDENGICFALGSRGPCSSTQLLGYDVFKRQLQCVVDPLSPDSSPSQRNELFHEAEDKQLYSQDYISERIGWIEYLIGISLLQRSKLMQPIERQDTAGILQVPSSLPDSLLQPCRSGDRQGANFKCANPLVSDSSLGGSLPPVPPLITCPADSFLQATGSCVDDSRAASCGPSSRFNEATGQCRSLF